MNKNASENGAVVGVRSVSGNNRAANPVATIAASPIRIKLARQPKAICRTPPIIGATIGAKALIDPISESSRAARTPA